MSSANSEDSLRKAIAYHKAGQLSEAEKMYREILAENQRCAGAWHMLGAIAYQVGRFEEGIQLINRAIELGLNSPELFNNLGECLRCLHRLEEATQAYRKAISMNPNHAEALSNLGLMLNDSRRFSDALPLLERAMKSRPNFANAQYNYGVALANLGRLDDAIEHWQAVLRINPDHLLTLKNLGLAMREKGRIDESVKLLKKLTEVHPKFAEGFADYGTTLAAAGQFEAAITAGEHVVEMALDRPEAHNALALIYAEAGRNKEALQSARKSVRLSPRFWPAMITLGGIYRKMEQYEEAEQWFKCAVETEPANIEAHKGVFDACIQQRRPDKALESSDYAIAKTPNDPQLHFNRAIALLSMGRLVEGFEEYEFRIQCRNFQPIVRRFDRPRWDGTHPNGRTILIHVEQGFGDMFQFARFIPNVIASGARVLVEVPWEVLSLFESIPGVFKVIERKQVSTIPDFDLHIHLASLPSVYKTSMESIPAKVPYLNVHVSNIARWKPRIDEHAKGLKVGIVWGGNAIPDPRRSCSLKEMAVLADVSGIDWYSLQVGEYRNQLKDAPVGMKILDVGKDLKDFSDTAAVLSQMDLVITIDTSVAHLAGALGCRTWVILPYVPDWRWQFEGETTRWYPTLRLFRQKLRGDWSMPIRHIRDELTTLSSLHSQCV